MNIDIEEEIINFVMEKANKEYSDDFPIQNIELWIREYFDLLHRERSKREDFDKLYQNQKKIWDSVEVDRVFTENDFKKSKMRCSEQSGN